MTIQASAMHSRNPAVPTARCWAGKGNVILDCPNQFIALFVEKLVIKDNIGTIHFKVPSLGEGPYRPPESFKIGEYPGPIPDCQWRRHVGPLGRSKTVPPGV